jgi:hypothetical protein
MKTATVAPVERKEGAFLECKASGEFVVRIATKRDASGQLVIDLDGDVYADGAVGEQPIVIGCWNHGNGCPGPAGTGETFETRADIRAAGRLLMETEHGRDEYARWQALGAQARFSYVYRVLDADFIEVRGQRVRRLKAIEVISVDLVATPAGVGTGIVSLKCEGCGGEAKEACTCGALTADERAKLTAIKVSLDLRRQRERFEGLQQAERLRAERRRYEAIKASLRHHYAEAEYVAPVTKHAARWAAMRVAEEHALEPVSVRFFRPALTGEKAAFSMDRPVWGKADMAAREVWIMADLHPWDAAATAAHEMGHFARPYRGEAGAVEIAAGFMAKLSGEADLMRSVWQWVSRGCPGVR